MPASNAGQPVGVVRVCQLLHSLTVGGAEVLARSIALGLRERIHFSFVCLDELGEIGEQLREEGFQVTVLGRRGGLDLGCGRRLRAVLQRHQADIVHAHQYTPFFYATLARGLGKRFPILFTEHGRHFPDSPSRKRRLYNRICLRRCDRIVGVGQAVEHALVSNEGIPSRRVEVIYNGVPLVRFSRTPPGVRSEVRQELSLVTDEFVVVQIARLDYLKDHRTAIDAMARLVARVPGARLLLVGDGPERSGIEHEIDRLGLGHIVRLLGVRRDVERLLAAADALLLTSISEGIPVTLIEGMAARLPVVSTDVGGVAEVVRDGETGFLAPAHDGSGLADALQRLAADATLRVVMGRLGAERAEQLFSDRQMHDAYARLYGQMAQI